MPANLLFPRTEHHQTPAGAASAHASAGPTGMLLRPGAGEQVHAATMPQGLDPPTGQLAEPRERLDEVQEPRKRRLAFGRPQFEDGLVIAMGVLSPRPLTRSPVDDDSTDQIPHPLIEREIVHVDRAGAVKHTLDVRLFTVVLEQTAIRGCVDWRWHGRTEPRIAT